MRYFFHVRDGHTFIDEDGAEYQTIEQAKAEAVRLAGALIKDLGGRFGTNRNGSCRLLIRIG